MAEEFQAGVCGGSWWMNPSRNSLFAGGFSMSPCSGALGDVASLGWPTDIGFGLTATSDWTQANLLLGRSTQSNFTTNMIQENGSDPATIRNPGPNFAGKVATVDQDSSTMDVFKQINQEFTTLDQSVNCTTPTTCQGLSTGFPVGSSNESNTNSCGYSSNMIKSFLLDEPPLNSMDYPPQSAMNSYGSSPDELSPPPPSFSKLSALLKPNTNSSLANSQAIGNNRMQFSNNTPFWNATTGVLNDVHSGFFASSQPSSLVAASFDEKPNRASLLATKATSKYVHQVSASAGKKSSPEPAYKRPKIETPSPLPTFKVRKEKLGDRITALQQLVAPFGKTDTASVLQEAIEYIKFLHNQVDVLSTPYMKNGVPIQNQLQVSNKMKDTEGPKQDLRTRGLCLVPISSTFPVANETPADFWTPSFGGSFR